MRECVWMHLLENCRHSANIDLVSTLGWIGGETTGIGGDKVPALLPLEETIAKQGVELFIGEVQGFS